MVYIVDIELHGHVKIPVKANNAESAENKAFDILADMKDADILENTSAEVYSITNDGATDYRW